MTRILLLFAFLICINCNAQIVNVESFRMQSDTVGWLGSVGAAFSFNKTTSKTFSGNIEGHFQYKTSRNTGVWLMLVNAGLLKVNNTRYASDAMLHLRYNKKLNEWLRWEIFGQIQNNYVTQIDSRLLLGTGPRFKLSEKKLFHLYLGCLLMYERETERTSPKIPHNDIRSSNYLSFTWLPRDYLEMISTTYFQPLIKKINDFRILNQLIFNIKATPHFSLTLKWNYLHDQFPAGTAPKTTYSFATGVTYHL